MVAYGQATIGAVEIPRVEDFIELREASSRGFNGWFIAISTLCSEVLGLGMGPPLVSAV